MGPSNPMDRSSPSNAMDRRPRKGSGKDPNTPTKGNSKGKNKGKNSWAEPEPAEEEEESPPQPRTFDRAKMKSTTSGLTFAQLMQGYKSIEEVKAAKPESSGQAEPEPVEEKRVELAVADEDDD